MEGNTSWEVVKPSKIKTSKDTPSIYIAKNGGITFSKTALKNLQEKTPETNIYECTTVDLYQNNETKEYAFKFSNEGQINLLYTRKEKDEKSRKICCTYIAKMLGTGTIEIKRFEENMMIFEKKEGD